MLAIDIVLADVDAFAAEVALAALGFFAGIMGYSIVYLVW